jgi:predicted pyridoxine 5'-phosphate oxidase superfamily flavin-nucleotide-binding protein
VSDTSVVSLHVQTNELRRSRVHARGEGGAGTPRHAAQLRTARGSCSSDGIGPDEAEFIAARDSFYLATVGENGWPYVQYRGGPKGFLRMLDASTLGFADFRGNGQYVSTGNVLSTHRACLFLMDYPTQTRLKIWAEAEISDEPAVIARVTDPTYNAQIERAFLFHVQAFDWNCHKYIVQRFHA